MIHLQAQDKTVMLLKIKTHSLKSIPSRYLTEDFGLK